MQVLEKESTTGPSKGVVVIESEQTNYARAIEELRGMKAREMALKYAAEKGLGSPAINGNPVGPYAVNARGETTEELEKQGIAATDPRRQPHRYRVEIPVTKGFGI